MNGVHWILIRTWIQHLYEYAKWNIHTGLGMMSFAWWSRWCWWCSYVHRRFFVLFVKFMRWQFDRRAALLLHLMFLSGKYLRLKGCCLHDSMIQAFNENINIYLAEASASGVGGRVTVYHVVILFSKWMDWEWAPHSPSQDWEYFDTEEIVNSDGWSINARGRPGEIKIKIITL